MTAPASLTPSPALPRVAAARWSAALLGVVAGVLTSYLQAWLSGPWWPLANSTSGWLLVAFVVGSLQRSVPAAAVLGAATCLGEVAGYYGASAARGFGVSVTFFVFWTVCGLVGGPVFGACGRLARCTTRHRAPFGAAIGAAAPAATFLGEGIGSYWLRLGDRQEAALFAAVGAVAAAVALAVVPGRLRTLAVIVVAGGAATLVYDFGLHLLD